MLLIVQTTKWSQMWITNKIDFYVVTYIDDMSVKLYLTVKIKKVTFTQ